MGKGWGCRGGEGRRSGLPPVYRPRQGRFPQPPGRVILVTLLVVAGYAAALAAGWLPPLGGVGQGEEPLPDSIRMEAARRMARALLVLAEERERRGLPRDPVADPNGTGLIGAEFTLITTTLGDPVAKRTATNPQWAAVVAEALWRVGARAGDVVAATLSGSFPGLNLAVFVAADVLGLRLAAVSSLGASMWGANLPQWTWADMEQVLAARGLIGQRSGAYTLGGEGDRGGGLFPEGVEALRAAVARSGGPPLLEPRDLDEAVELRLALFDEVAARAGRSIAAYVNVGGGQAALGSCSALLTLQPGLLWPEQVPACPPKGQGVLSRMADRKVPVIHLLNIRELALRNGLPLDPVPLPEVPQP